MGNSSSKVNKNKSKDKHLLNVTIRYHGEVKESIAISGSFIQWNNKLPMVKDDDDLYSIVLKLPAGVHEYKFFIDGRWRCAPEQPIRSDPVGNVNNYIKVTDSIESKPVEDAKLYQVVADFNCDLPDERLFEGVDPNPIPQQINGTPLNANISEVRNDIMRNVGESILLPIPSHQVLTHSYINDQGSTMNTGVTTRFRTKYVTTMLILKSPSSASELPGEDIYEALDLVQRGVLPEMKSIALGRNLP